GHCQIIYLKVLAVLDCQQLIHCASLYPQSSQVMRQKRMTPFWRGISRPIGASCRDNSECSTRLCRYFLLSL
uniref:Liver-expressed antimicrobial peptide 2 n=1 Tax=Varanus komodoensis TaxID=61221 RepID=A0A8D2Q3P6_VARKO